ncbi:pleckstrin homology domain-containing family S member 1 isoform X2 [Microcaecilia unicolor]|nr:pleckstrin homology domain-containing family S member 1 isoform X2 [Microcaecilia unicolor]XP_030060624.1 pleckstrin homology domain-containing family S member 1 isoform X2 [Microcaecilia unicolor]
MFYEGNEVCKQGHLRKSPPSNLFSSQSSWKKRLFILTKSKQNAYALHYYKNQNLEKRGLIEISKILEIQQGIKDDKKRAAVSKMFQSEPDKVISLSTADREYFLIGEEIKDVEEWLESISSAWEATKKEKNSDQNQSSGATEEAFVIPAFTLPFPHFVIPDNRETSSKPKIKIAEAVQNPGWPLPDTSFIEEKKRPPSDPFPRSPPHLDVLHLGNGMRPHSCPLPNPPTIYSMSKPEMGHVQTLDNPYSQQEMKGDEIYDVPRKWENSVSEEPEECDDLPESGNETQESGDEVDSQPHYMKMNSIIDSLPKGRASATDTQSSAKNHDEKESCRKCSAHADGGRSQSVSNHCRHSDEPNFDKKRNGHSEFKLTILLTEHVDQDQLEKLNIDLSKEDIKYLTLTEIGNRVCVSDWQGPSCVFNYGDQITSINDLGVQCKADVLEDIDRAIKKSVTLSILRIPNSKVFHSEKCLCSRHH